MESLTNEERELLKDPAIAEMLFALKSEREEQNRKQEHERLRQEKLDTSMVESFEKLTAKGKVGREWVETWKSFKEAEALLLSKMRTLSEKLLWLEDDEQSSREKCSVENNQQRSEIQTLESEKRQWLCNNDKWRQEFETNFSQQWQAERYEVTAKRNEYLNARSEADIDEETINNLKEKLRSLR
eukprot:GILI01031639.1.p1 GENE.GILI01031639.1~~GILI01031639.1.p1  ORF type:complete len:185 (-),score=14.26 GILI01031639.1:59-613(-)